jgi:hypothetical protein
MGALQARADDPVSLFWETLSLLMSWKEVAAKDSACPGDKCLCFVIVASSAVMRTYGRHWSGKLCIMTDCFPVLYS